MNTVGLSLDDIIKKNKASEPKKFNRRFNRDRKFPKQVTQQYRFLKILFYDSVDAKKIFMVRQQRQKQFEQKLHCFEIIKSSLQRALKRTLSNFLNKEIFQQYSGFIKCEIDWDEIGRSKVLKKIKGTATIEFSNMDSAQTAMEDHNGKFYSLEKDLGGQIISAKIQKSAPRVQKLIKKMNDKWQNDKFDDNRKDRFQKKSFRGFNNRNDRSNRNSRNFTFNRKNKKFFSKRD